MYAWTICCYDEFAIECKFLWHSNAPINVKPAGRGGWGGGEKGGAWGGILTFSKRLQSNSLPPGKNVRSNITKFPTPRNDLWSRARTKIQISLPLGQQENSNALPPGQSDRSKSRPMPPPLPLPRRLDIDRYIKTRIKHMRFGGSHWCCSYIGQR